MEEPKKTKKVKKRRHRGDKLENAFHEEGAKGTDDKEDANRNVYIKVDSNFSNQFAQTDLSTIEESRDCLNEKDEQIKNMSERLQQVTSKLYETKNAYTTLKQDYNKVQKLLCSEVGENVTAQGLLSQPGWRGRAEQILQLQQKVSELQGKLSETDATSKKPTERRSLSGLRTYDKEKKQQIENLTRDLKEAEVAREDLKKKLEAAKARRSVLENDLATSKKTVALLNEKTMHDNQLIEALHAQLKITEGKLQDRDAVMRRQSEKCEREIVLVKSELEAAQIHMSNYRRQIEDKDKELENLRLRNEEQPRRESPTPSPKNANEHLAVNVVTEVERERLLEFVTVLNRRLEEERGHSEQISDLLRKERNRAAKLETRLQKMELERAGLSRASSGSYRFRGTKDLPKFGDPEELQLKLELLQEECLTVKTRLATLQKEKAADLATFKRMLEQTRKMFKDACRGKLPGMGSHTTSVITI